MAASPPEFLSNQRRMVAEIEARRLSIESLPIELYFSAEHRCNIRCIHCMATVERNHGIVPLMDQDLPDRARDRFEKIRHLLPSARFLSFTGSGEPLMGRALPEILRSIAGSPCRTHFNSNGTLLNRKRAQMLVDVQLDEILISMDGATRGTFERIRAGARWDQVIAGIQALVRAKEQGQSTKPQITFAGSFLRQNIEELPALIDLAADLGVSKVVANNTIVYDPAMEHESLLHHRSLTQAVLAVAERRAQLRGIWLVNRLVEGIESPPPWSTPHRDDSQTTACAVTPSGNARAPLSSILPPLPGLPADLPPIVHACQKPWSGLYVENNGYVKVCIYDSPPIGNLDQQSLDEIWNGPLVRDLRRSFLEDDPPRACRDCFIFAKTQPRRDVRVQPVKARLAFIDAPALEPWIAGDYDLLGWAIDAAGVDRVEVLLDGRKIGDAEYGEARADVAAAHPDLPESGRSGVRFRIHVDDYTAGDHRLQLRVVNRQGATTESPVRPACFHSSKSALRAAHG